MQPLEIDLGAYDHLAVGLGLGEHAVRGPAVIAPRQDGAWPPGLEEMRDVGRSASLANQVRAGENHLPPLPCLGGEEIAILRSVLVDPSEIRERRLLPPRERGEQLDREELGKEHQVGAASAVEQLSSMLGELREATDGPERELAGGDRERLRHCRNLCDPYAQPGLADNPRSCAATSGVRAPRRGPGPWRRS